MMMGPFGLQQILVGHVSHGLAMMVVLQSVKQWFFTVICQIHNGTGRGCGSRLKKWSKDVSGPAQALIFTVAFAARRTHDVDVITKS